jgi:flavin reductase (DIM6/NTAB) family NADH-FMN oxidoreductase RutF
VGPYRRGIGLRNRPAVVSCSPNVTVGLITARRFIEMDTDLKKTALRMIPYGLYVLTSEASDGTVAASTVNWVTQASFEPPLVAVGVKADSGAHAVIKESGSFALNVLGKAQQSLAFAFFKPAEREGNTIAGEAFSSGKSGAPILGSAAAFLDCRLTDTVERGDHSIFVGEVIDVGVREEISGRPDDATLALRDLGEKTFYGG